MVAMDRAFGANLTRLERYRARQADITEEAQKPVILTEADIADRVARHGPDMDPAAPSGAEVAAATDAPPPGPAAADQGPEALVASAASRLAGLNRKARREMAVRRCGG